MAVDDLVGGTHYPTDGTVNPGLAALAFAKGAVDRGVRYVPDTAVSGFLRGDRGAVTGVTTSRGEISAETVVLAARGCGPRSSRASPAPASRCGRPSTCG